METGLDAVAKQLVRRDHNPMNTTLFVLTDGEDDSIKNKSAANAAFNQFYKKVGRIRVVPLDMEIDIIIISWE